MVDCFVGDVFEAQQDLSPGVGAEVYPLLHPDGLLAPTAAPGVAHAEGIAIGVIVGGMLPWKDVPALASIGGDLHVGVIPSLLDVIPQPGLQCRSFQPTKVEGAGEGHVALVAVVGPPLVAAAVRVVGYHPDLRRALECHPQIALALQEDVVGTVLVDGGPLL